MRGARLFLSNPEIVIPQINALLRLSLSFPIRLLIPMVTVEDEVEYILKCVEACKKKLNQPTKKFSLSVGAMVETPAAALAVNRITELVDFVSIGTNDLIQYTMAACREDQNVAHLFSRGFEYIYPLIKSVANVCNKKNMECGVCGEVAGDEQYLKRLVECGISHFSVPCNRIPYLKNVIKASVDE